VKIIGISGYPRSGKDTLGELLIQAGYYGVSFGDIIRGYARQRHADKPDPISVANMTETANWLRNERGADVVLKEALSLYETEQAAGKDYKGFLIISVRAPVEVDFILSHEGQLVWVEVDDNIRYKRDKNARRVGEMDISFEEFKRQEGLQSKPQPGIPPEAQMDMEYVRSKATLTIGNNGSNVEVFKQTAKAALGL
jgi:dephospho-CoA kinase